MTKFAKYVTTWDHTRENKRDKLNQWLDMHKDGISDLWQNDAGSCFTIVDESTFVLFCIQFKDIAIMAKNIVDVQL